jgi:hypothetical protein
MDSSMALLVKLLLAFKFLKTLTLFKLCSSPFEIFNSMPTAPINTIKLVPPALINGSGMPVGGMLPVTTAILINN